MVARAPATGAERRAPEAKRRRRHRVGHGRDRHGRRGRTLLSWNPAAERIFGYDASEVVGRSLTMLMPERFRDAHRAGHARVVETGETRVIGQTVELAGLRKDGAEFPIELSLSTWTEDGTRLTGRAAAVSEAPTAALLHSSGL